MCIVPFADYKKKVTKPKKAVKHLEEEKENQPPPTKKIKVPETPFTPVVEEKPKMVHHLPSI